VLSYILCEQNPRFLEFYTYVCECSLKCVLAGVCVYAYKYIHRVFSGPQPCDFGGEREDRISCIAMSVWSGIHRLHRNVDGPVQK